MLFLLALQPLRQDETDTAKSLSRYLIWAAKAVIQAVAGEAGDVKANEPE